MSNTFTSSGTITGTFNISATGPFGFAKGLLSGGTATGAIIKAVATSANTQAIIGIEETVNGGSIAADGNAQIYLDGATISGASLATSGALSEIGVNGGGSATVTSATVSKGSYILDDGTLTFSGGAAQDGVTFLAYGTRAYGPDVALTLSNTALGAKDNLLAQEGGLLVVSAASGGTTTFSAGTVVSATAGGTVDIYGGVNNLGNIGAIAVGVQVGDTVAVSAGTGGGFINAKGALVEAEANGGAYGSAEVWISGGAAAINSGTIVASAGNGYEKFAGVQFEGGTLSNAKGASIEEVSTAITGGTAYLYGSSGVTNNGSITGLASDDSYYNENTVVVYATSGNIANTGTIGVTATASSTNSLDIDNTSGGLTNAKGAVISASASGDSEIRQFTVGVGGAINNSGTIALATSADSSASGTYDHYLGGTSLTNSGSITATASADSSAELDIYATSGSVFNIGTIAATAATDSYLELEGYASEGLTNSGNMTAVATADSEAYNYWSLDGGTVVNATTMQASASSDSSAYFGVDGFISGTNSGSFTATATDDSRAEAEFSGDFVVNTNKMTATAAADSEAQLWVTANGSGGTPALLQNTGTIAAIANAGGTAYTTVYGDNSSASIINNKLLEASAAGGTAYMYIRTYSDSAVITNSSTIEAAAAGGTAYVGLGGDNEPGAFVNNSGGMLLATETAGTAYIDLGDYDAKVSGGILKTVGADAYLGVIGYDEREASATSVTIAADSNIVGWDGTLDIANIVGSISAGTLVQAANDGTVDIFGNVSNSGTIQAFATTHVGGYEGDGSVSIFGGTAGIVTNTKTIEAVATSAYYYEASVYISAPTISNTKTGVIEVLATADSYEDNNVTVLGASITNSGSILASASDSSDASVTVSGGTAGGLVNSSAGKIEALATAGSTAYASVEGSATNAGLIAAQADGVSEATILLDGSLNNTGGTLLATGNAVIVFEDATVTGGTLRTSGPHAAALAYGGGVGTLSGVTIASGSLVLAEDGGTLTLDSGTVIAGSKTALAVVDAYASSGDVVVSGTVQNSGLLLAGGALGGGTVTITSGAVVSGNAVGIDEFGVVNVVSGGTANVDFGVATIGTLEIADTATTSAVYTGTVSGFGGVGGEFPDQLIDLADVSYASNTFSATYSLTTSSANPNLDIGTLTVSSGGGVVAVITLEGNYVSGTTFSIVDDGGTVAISDPTAPTTLAGASNPSAPFTGTGNAALLGGYIASLFASPEGQAGASTAEPSQTQTVLVHPHA